MAGKVFLAAVGMTYGIAFVGGVAVGMLAAAPFRTLAEYANRRKLSAAIHAAMEAQRKATAPPRMH